MMLNKIQDIFKQFNGVLLGTILIYLLASCHSENTSEQHDKPVFSITNAAETNITFNNELKENMTMNGLLYEYYYNGAGVSIEDFNGDGLMDIYFISNLESNKFYLNKGNMQFQDVTSISGLNGKYGFPGGTTTTDINGDGLIDIYICKSGKFEDPDQRRNELYINTGNTKQGVPIFKESAAEYGLDLPHFSTQAAFFDFDKDDDLDLFLINHGIEVYGKSETDFLIDKESEYRGARLYRNDGGKFHDVSDEMGIINTMIGFGLGLSLADVNNDGWTDVYVANDFDEKDHLYLNQKGEYFTEVSQSAFKQMSFFSMGTDIADINNDGWMDIVTLDMMASDNYTQKTSMSGMNPDRFYDLVDMGLHHQYMYNGMQINRGNKVGENTPLFSNVAFMNGVSQTDWSWGPLLFDFNNDGTNDLYISNGIKRDFRNNDFQIFHKARQKQRAENLKNNTAVDSKTYIEEIMERMPIRPKKDYFFLNERGDLRFKDISNEIVHKVSKSNGAAYADLDNDGDLDLVINNMDDTAFVYRNNTDLLSNYIQVNLTYKGGNSKGYGSKITIHYEGNLQSKEVHATRGFQSSCPSEVHFGLGSISKIDSAVVLWPNGEKSVVKDMMVNNKNNIIYNKVKHSNNLYEHQGDPLFVEIKNAFGGWKHTENDYNDFIKESLLPHRMSQFGPAMAVGDVNGDGLDDVYFGNAIGEKGGLFIQSADGTFARSAAFNGELTKAYEEVSALFFDADGDQDLDLYIATGGNEFPEGSPNLKDFLLVNDGKGNFNHADVLPSTERYSASVVKAADIDKDGDLDLIIGGRQNPGNYPLPGKTILLLNRTENGSVKFVEENKRLPEESGRFGMVTDIAFTDVNQDQSIDMIMVGEWMEPMIMLNDGKGYFSESKVLNDDGLTGWWNKVFPLDLTGNNKPDFILGNLGENYKYQASKDAPFEIYMNDFDANNSNDIVLAYHQNGETYPLRGRECSSNQMPFIKKKFPDYESFGSANLIDIYDEVKLDSSYSLKAQNFEHSIFIQGEDGHFERKATSPMSQISAINAISSFDVGNQKYILMAGNQYHSEVETPRSDAGYGVLYEIVDGKLEFINNTDHGAFLEGHVSQLESIRLAGGKMGVIAAINDEAPVLYRISEKENL